MGTIWTPDKMSESGVFASVSSKTWSHTNVYADILIVTAQVRDAASNSDIDITGITFNSVALTNAIAAEYVNPAYLRSEIWYLIAPAVGTFNIAITYTGTIDTGTAQAVSFKGAKQTSPVHTTNSATADAAAGLDTSVSIAPTVDDCLIIDSFYNKTGSDLTMNSAQTIIGTQGLPNAGGDRSGASYKRKVAAGSTSMSWVASPDDDWISVAAAFLPATYTGKITMNKLRPKIFAPGRAR